MSKGVAYLTRLKSHPGVSVMCMITPAFVFAGMSNENLSLWGGAGFGLAISVPFWAVVLWTARNQPTPKVEADK